MEVTERKITPADFPKLKGRFKTTKEILSDSAMMAILLLFGMMLISYLIDLAGVNTAGKSYKIVTLSLAIAFGCYHFVTRLQKYGKYRFKEAVVNSYKFEVKEFNDSTYSHTEFTDYVLRTTDNKTILLNTEKLNSQNIKNAFEIEIVKPQKPGAYADNIILSLKNYSTGKEVKRVGFKNTPDYERYDSSFEFIDDDIT